MLATKKNDIYFKSIIKLNFISIIPALDRGIKSDVQIRFPSWTPRWNFDFTLIQVQSYRMLAFVASKVGSAKTRWEMTSMYDRGPLRTEVNARKCHPGIHSRSRSRPNSSVSLSTKLSVRARFRPARPADLKTQVLTSKPNFLPDFRGDLLQLRTK